MDIENEYGTLEIQRGLLEILKRVDKLCLDNGIRYSLLAGSMLGAVRHRGFIPWDDDADIVVDRSQYQKLSSLIASDPMLSMSKMLWVDRLNLKDALNNGSSPTVDLFILDNVPDNKILKKTKILIILTLQRMIMEKPAYHKYSFINKILAWVLHICGKLFSKKSLLELYSKASQISNSKTTNYKAIYCDQYRYLRNEYRTDLFAKTRRCLFEDTNLNIIDSFDDYLTEMYGDWRTPPEQSERKPQHMSQPGGSMDYLKALHEEQLNLSKALIKVCDRYGLKLFACYGTLLGAIRHKGFIPWDDDIDFVMPREDYDKLASLPASEFPSPYVLEDCVTLHRFINPNTTFVQLEKSRIANGLSYGVWVDVFCLDAVPDDPMEFKTLCKKVKLRQRLLVNYRFRSYANGGFISKLYHLVIRCFFLFVNSEKENVRVQELLRKNKIENNSHLIEYGVNLTYTPFDRLKLYNKEWFKDTVKLPFEYIELPCPSGWNEILTLKYGDYMTPRKVSTVHGKVLVDLDTSGNTTMSNFLARLPFYKRYWYTH